VKNATISPLAGGQMELYILSGRRKNGTIRPIWQEDKWNYRAYLAGGKMELYVLSGRRTNGTIGPIWQEEKWNYTSYLAGGQMEL
jgi:hypothetical protein